MDNHSHDEGYPSFMDVIALVMDTKFQLGAWAITRNALDLLDPQDVFDALKRHSQGDWGDVPSEDKFLNNEALKEGGRLFSAYKDRNSEPFWIITEADRSITTILLPEDY